MIDHSTGLYDSSRWNHMDFKDVKKEFYHNLDVVSRRIDRLERHRDFVAAKEQQKSMGI